MGTQGKLDCDTGEQIAGSTFLRLFCGSRGEPETEVTKNQPAFT
jgi:hypothetical protein